MFKKFLLFLTTGALIAPLCSPLWGQDIIPNNHFKAYSISPKPFSFSALTEDQFMQDGLFLMGPLLLANPVQKDTFPIIDTTHHLHWYYAEGRDTSIQVNYENQFETTTVQIDSVRFLLVPAQKLPHDPPTNLDHYKCYRIMQQQWLQKKPFMQDQFTDERADSLRRDLFCTPCQKNTEPMIDTITHYVAYLIAPGQPFIPPLIRQVDDQFASPVAPWVDTVLGSKYLLVPTIKNLPPPPPDTGKNHYKTWRIEPVTPAPTNNLLVKDQFMTDTLQTFKEEYLSNPVRKIVTKPDVTKDTFDIVDPDDHLTWYLAVGRDTLLTVEYVNQFESTAVVIDSVRFLLVPTQKLPHPTYDSFDHYKAYRIRNPQLFNLPVQLQDQFDLTPELITSLTPRYFLTPAQKDLEPVYDLTIHYVAYQIDPMSASTEQRTLIDQFGSRDVMVLASEMILVPTRKLLVTSPPECSDGIDNDGDGLVDFPADCGCTGPADPTEAPNPATECNDGTDNDGDGLVDYPADCGCTDVCDNSESPDPVTNQCNDGIDNDLDGFIDFPADLGCSDPCDNDEFNPFDTGANHFKTWMTTQPQGLTAMVTVTVKDQFMSGPSPIFLDSLFFFSNPVRKIVGNDTFDVTDPDEHLTWYRAAGGNHGLKKVIYENQFESTTVEIDSLKYLLVPARKLPHPKPESLDHYLAYRIKFNQGVPGPVILQDQFDSPIAPELITNLSQRYFLTPAKKNNEPQYDTLTHYVAYGLIPPGTTSQARTVIDQFDTFNLQFGSSTMLLVPTDKLCDAIPGDANASGTLTLGDAISIVNYVFSKPGCAPLPLCWLSGKLCRGDVNGSCTVTLADAIWLVNYIFAKPCAGPGAPPCCWKPIGCPGSTCCLPNPICP